MDLILADDIAMPTPLAAAATAGGRCVYKGIGGSVARAQYMCVCEIKFKWNSQVPDSKGKESGGF